MVKTKMLVKLESKGFNITEAMNFCADSEDIYREVLISALEEGKEKLPLFVQCLKNADAERYRVEVHGIKNVAKTIGATSLWEIAEIQNNAAKTLDLNKIKKGNEEFLDIFRVTLDIISEILEEAQGIKRNSTVITFLG